MIAEYKTVFHDAGKNSGDGLARFDELVMEYIKKGWEPVGGFRRDGAALYQTMIRRQGADTLLG